MHCAPSTMETAALSLKLGDFWRPPRRVVPAAKMALSNCIARCFDDRIGDLLREVFDKLDDIRMWEILDLGLDEVDAVGQRTRSEFELLFERGPFLAAQVPRGYSGICCLCVTQIDNK